MIVKQYIKEFENLGFGMFIHFGLYSVLESGEWVKKLRCISDQEYEALMGDFEPKQDWAQEIVKIGKNAGCKYITLTTRHHDGFSLYDTCGLNTYDALHAKCGRDLVKEFVEACRKEGIIPFFYHTLLDWHEDSYETDFPKYLKFLRSSVEILCKNYGKIGGIWFDGMWDKLNEDWEEDALYGVIRKYQPEAMIINNTGLSAQGALGHIELDSVTFERGKPQVINMNEKYVASEMCEVFATHWGYAKEDLNYKAPSDMICELADCRRYGSNMLINLGPNGVGDIRLIDSAILDIMGQWIKYFDEAIRNPKPCDIVIENKEKDFLLKSGKNYYLFCYDLPMSADPNVALKSKTLYSDQFKMKEKILSINWMDNNEALDFIQEKEYVMVRTMPYAYGRDLVVRVAKITCE